MSLRTLLLGIALSSLLTGCLSLSTPSLERTWQGRFSISATTPQRQENHSGRFLLTHSEIPETILDLKTSLGNTIARVSQTPSQVSLEAVGSPTRYAKNAETLLMQTFGFSVPIDGLEYWIDGETIPGYHAQTTPSLRPYSEIRQNGWVIHYESFDTTGLPKRIRLQRDPTDTTPALSILLLISNRNDGS